MNWIKSALPEGWHALSFNFFVSWNRKVVSGPFWLTRLLVARSDDELLQSSNQDILNALTSNGSLEEEFNLLKKLCEKLDTFSELVLLSELKPYNINLNTPVWKISQSYEVSKIELRVLEELITNYREGIANMGNKTLYYGTSAIECYLANNNRNIYPGDCDCLIVDSSLKPKAIIEIKKHTKNEEIDKHLVSRYYPSPDGRKYDSLFYLKDKISQISNQDIPVSVVYFATNFYKFRVQKIQKGSDSCRGLNTLKDTGDISYDLDGNARNGEIILKAVL